MKFAVIHCALIVFDSCANSQQLEIETVTNRTFKVCGTITSSSSYCGVQLRALKMNSTITKNDHTPAGFIFARAVLTT